MAAPTRSTSAGSKVAANSSPAGNAWPGPLARPPAIGHAQGRDVQPGTPTVSNPVPATSATFSSSVMAASQASTCRSVGECAPAAGGGRQHGGRRNNGRRAAICGRTHRAAERVVAASMARQPATGVDLKKTVGMVRSPCRTGSMKGIVSALQGATVFDSGPSAARRAATNSSSVALDREFRSRPARSRGRRRCLRPRRRTKPATAQASAGVAIPNPTATGRRPSESSRTCARVRKFRPGWAVELP